jgi:hypothetical protein
VSPKRSARSATTSSSPYYHIVRDQVPFRELGPDWQRKRYSVEHRARRLQRQLEALGYTVTLDQIQQAVTGHRGESWVAVWSVRMRQLEVRLLGRFEALVDSRPVPVGAWAQRRAADLVKLLALAPGHRMPRDEVLEMLWPKLGADAAASNLHKAASYARRALGDRGAVVLRGGMVELAPAAEVTTDVERFEGGDDSAYVGELLPDDRYEHWTLRPRARLRERRLAGDALAGPLGGGAARGRRR